MQAFSSCGEQGFTVVLGFSLRWFLLLQNTGSRWSGSVVEALGLSCSAACGIFPDQGLNYCPLHWQADSYPLCHQGSPLTSLSVKVKNNSVWSRDGSARYTEVIMKHWAAAVPQPCSGVVLKDTRQGNTWRARALSITPSCSLYMAEVAWGWVYTEFWTVVVNGLANWSGACRTKAWKIRDKEVWERKHWWKRIRVTSVSSNHIMFLMVKQGLLGFFFFFCHVSRHVGSWFVFFFFNVYYLFWLCWDLVLAHWIFHLCCGWGIWIQFPQQGLNLDTLHWELGVVSTGHPENSRALSFLNMFSSKTILAFLIKAKESRVWK